MSSLRERGGTGFGGVRLRKTIVTLQVAFTLILLIGAALFLRTLTSLLAQGPGFDTSGLLSFAIAPTQNGYSDANASRLVRRLDEQVRALPAARSSAAARFAFLNGGAWSNKVTMQTDHRTVSDGIINFNAVSPGFFSTLGVPSSTTQLRCPDQGSLLLFSADRQPCRKQVQQDSSKASRLEIADLLVAQ